MALTGVVVDQAAILLTVCDWRAVEWTRGIRLLTLLSGSAGFVVRAWTLSGDFSRHSRIVPRITYVMVV